MSQTGQSERRVVGRFAPSPTGDLHLGNVRTALVAWLAARAAGGRVLMRTEDLDLPRCLPGAEGRILAELGWLGFDWDEGPDVGGPHAPYRQSERAVLFTAALHRLAAAGHLYACTCSRKDLASLARLASAPHGPGDDGPVYPGTCRDRGLPLELDAVPPPGGRVPALRFRVAAGQVGFDDQIAGSFAQDVARDVGDFVVRRADGVLAYQLAVVVDDAAMGVNQVVRGADLLDSTPRQIQLLQALAAPIPRYAHVPLVLDAQGRRLAKRDAATAIRALREGGRSPKAIVGELAWSLGLRATPSPLTPTDLVADFAWARLSRQAWRTAE